MRSPALHSLCAGRISRGRCITVAPLADGRHLVLVVALPSLAVLTEAVLDEPPGREYLRCLTGGLQ